MEDDILSRTRRDIVAVMNQYPSEPEAWCALTTTLLTLAHGLAKAQPPELRLIWAKAFYSYADDLVTEAQKDE